MLLWSPGTGTDTKISAVESMLVEGKKVVEVSSIPPRDTSENSKDEGQAKASMEDASIRQELVPVVEQSLGETFGGQSFSGKKARLLLAEEGEKGEWFDGKIVAVDPKQKTVRFVFDESGEDFIDIAYDSPELQIVGQEVEVQVPRPEEGGQRKQGTNQKLTKPKGQECVGWIVQYSLTDEVEEKIGFEGKVLAYDPKQDSIRVVFDGEEVEVSCEDEDLVFVTKQ